MTGHHSGQGAHCGSPPYCPLPLRLSGQLGLGRRRTGDLVVQASWPLHMVRPMPLTSSQKMPANSKAHVHLRSHRGWPHLTGERAQVQTSGAAPAELQGLGCLPTHPCSRPEPGSQLPAPGFSRAQPRQVQALGKASSRYTGTRRLPFRNASGLSQRMLAAPSCQDSVAESPGWECRPSLPSSQGSVCRAPPVHPESLKHPCCDAQGGFSTCSVGSP